jgi:hypothetical protein
MHRLITACSCYHGLGRSGTTSTSTMRDTPKGATSTSSKVELPSQQHRLHALPGNLKRNPENSPKTQVALATPDTPGSRQLQYSSLAGPVLRTWHSTDACVGRGNQQTEAFVDLLPTSTRHQSLQLLTGMRASTSTSAMPSTLQRLVGPSINM